MDQLFQKKKVLVEVLRTADGKEHFHQEIELLYVLEGSVFVATEGQETTLQPHDILIINAHKAHTLSVHGDTLYLKLSIQYSLIADIVDYWDILFYCDSTRDANGAYSGLEALLQKLLGHHLTSRGNAANFAHIALCYQLLDYLCAHFLVRSSTAALDGDEENRYQARLAMIENYIHANYASPISLKDLSTKLYLSTGYLTRFFHKNYGMTFGAYLTRVRLHHAMDALLYSDLPITRVVYDCGFANVSMFNKSFKSEYGETPSAVRKRTEKESRHEETLTEDTVHRLENVLWSPEAPDETASRTLRVTVPTETTTPLPRFWNQAVNIGAAIDLFQSSVQEHVAYLGRTMGFRYIRFWSAFTREMLIDSSQLGPYNFSRLDTVLDFLMEHQLRPWLELGYKPRRLERSNLDSVLFVDIDTPPTVDHHAQLLDTFLRHVIERYGREEVDNWIFEHSIDYKEIFSESSVSMFLERFQTTRTVLRRHLEHAPLGGCGLHGHAVLLDRQSSAVDLFRTRVRQAGLVPDFITLYLYAYDHAIDTDALGARVSYSRSADIDWHRHSIEVMQQEAPEILDLHIPVRASEWGRSVSQRSFINDSCFQGAYIIRNVIDLIDQVDALVYFQGTDRVSELYDTSDSLFGGSGLLSRDGIVKPAGFAFEFLHQLYGQLVAKAKHYIVTTDGHDKYCILCHNLKPLSYLYYLEDESQLDRAHMKKYFEDTEPMQLELTLTGLQPGTYRLRCQRVNEDLGSVFQKWRELGFAGDLQKTDIRYLRKVCEPHLSIHCLSVPEGKLTLHHTLQANEFACLQLIRKP